MSQRRSAVPALVAALAAVALIAGCTSARQHPEPSTPTATPSPTRPAVIATAVTVPNRNAVYALNGARWTTIALPHPPADPTAVAAHDQDVYAATVDGTSVALDTSHDAGRSWQHRHITDATDLPEIAGVDLALSPDGRRLALMLDAPSSAGAVAQASVLVAPRWVPNQAPASGQLSWWRDRLVLSGGALSSRFFVGDATGATWTLQPIAGPVAPATDVNPRVPSFGAAATRPDGGLLVPVTTHGRPPRVDLYDYDARTARRVGGVALSGNVGAGTTVAVVQRPDGAVVIADAVSPRLRVVQGGTARSVSAKGLPAPPTTLMFVTATAGLARVDVAGCTHAKRGCSTRPEVFATGDGGASWVALT
jgi:hypothetical protein